MCIDGWMYMWMDELMKGAPLNIINHNRNKETTTNVRIKYGLLICTTNAELHNSQV